MTKADPTRKVGDVTWEVPPVPTKYDWPAIAQTLRGKPNEWARIFEHDRTSVVNAIRQGKVIDVHPALGFEIKTTNNDRGYPRMCDLYLRFVPEKENPMSLVLMMNRKES